MANPRASFSTNVAAEWRQIQRCASDRARLIEALRPFAETAKLYEEQRFSSKTELIFGDGFNMTVGHLRAAADLVREMEERADGE